MASILKRKRGSLEVPDVPKRAKSVLDTATNSVKNIGAAAGWEAAFHPPNATATSLIKTNGVNGTENSGEGKSQSPEAIDFDLMQAGDFEQGTEDAHKLQPWALSESIAGRMLNHEPVFSKDEK